MDRVLKDTGIPTPSQRQKIKHLLTTHITKSAFFGQHGRASNNNNFL